jgi:hypothetical protein
VVCSDQALQEARFSLPLGRIQVSEPGPLIREALVEHGFHLRLEEHQGTIYLRADRNALAPAATLVSHLGIVLAFFVVLIAAGFVWREPLAIPANAAVALQHEPELRVGFEDFKIERYPDGSAADYQAAVHIVDGTRTVGNGIIRLNEPLTYAGIALYLQGSSGLSDNKTLMLLAVHDPGYGFVVRIAALTASTPSSRSWRDVSSISWQSRRALKQGARHDPVSLCSTLAIWYRPGCAYEVG